MEDVLRREKEAPSCSSDALLLLEHSSVYTLGRSVDVANQVEKEHEVYRISRGGEVTWHGPGQLVAYPILNLAHPHHKKDLRWYVHQLEEVLIKTLRGLGIKGERSKVNSGQQKDRCNTYQRITVGNDARSCSEYILRDEPFKQYHSLRYTARSGRGDVCWRR